MKLAIAEWRSKDGSVYLWLQQSGGVKREAYTYGYSRVEEWRGKRILMATAEWRSEEGSYSRVEEWRGKLIATPGPKPCCHCGGCPGRHDGQHQMVRLALYWLWPQLCCSCPQFVVDTLISTADNRIEREGVLATKLCTHKDDVFDINSKKLNALAGWCCYFGFPLNIYHAPQNDTSVNF